MAWTMRVHGMDTLLPSVHVMEYIQVVHAMEWRSFAMTLHGMKSPIMYPCPAMHDLKTVHGMDVWGYKVSVPCSTFSMASGVRQFWLQIPSYRLERGANRVWVGGGHALLDKLKHALDCLPL